MPRFLTAAVVGVALGLGRGSTQRLPAAHDDGSTWSGAEVLLNQKVIDGQSTVVCTEVQAMFDALKTAAQRWERLSAALGRESAGLLIAANSRSLRLGLR